VKAIIEEIWGPPSPKPKPKVVVEEAEVIRDADVRVSPDDPTTVRATRAWLGCEGPTS
jgi:hypothetical protein